MFLHSGASLHGHEYSSRDTSTAGLVVPRRNSLLRSSFATPTNRATPYADSHSTSPNTRTASTSSRRVRLAPVSDCLPASPNPAVRFSEPPEHATAPGSNVEEMSEDGASAIVDVSDSDISRAASLTKPPRRRSNRQCTSYLLAQAPPTMNKKQRLLHIRPKLLLQLQQVPVNQRPRPIIDVYPTSGIVNTAIAAHLCKRFPRLSRIKSEKSIQDVLLLKSEDYATSDLESDSDGDEESIKNRDIIAILSPLAGQDKAEIALPDGTTWAAAPSMKNNRLSYEFTTVDADGRTITARWVRRQIITKPAPTTSSLPATPLAPMSPSHTMSFPLPPASPPPDFKFTFSIIDPSCRQHPVMATLLPSCLEIQGTYTTVSQSSSRYPPTSQQLGSPEGSTAEEEPTSERNTRPVEEWQKSFIQISALWVALRHGWIPHCKLADFIPESASMNAVGSAGTKLHNRSRSYSTGTDVGQTTMSRTLTGRLRRLQPLLQEEGIVKPGVLPRRATSTGAARMQKYRAERMSEMNDPDQSSSLSFRGRRVRSGDWNGNMANRYSTGLVGIVDSETLEFNAQPSAGRTSASPLVSPDTVTPSKRPLSELYTSNPMSERTSKKSDIQVAMGGPKTTAAEQPRKSLAKEEKEGKRKHHRWKSVTAWFSKLRVC